MNHYFFEMSVNKPSTNDTSSNIGTIDNQYNLQNDPDDDDWIHCLSYHSNSNISPTDNFSSSINERLEDQHMQVEMDFHCDSDTQFDITRNSFESQSKPISESEESAKTVSDSNDLLLNLDDVLGQVNDTDCDWIESMLKDLDKKDSNQESNRNEISSDSNHQIEVQNVKVIDEITSNKINDGFGYELSDCENTCKDFKRHISTEHQLNSAKKRQRRRLALENEEIQKLKRMTCPNPNRRIRKLEIYRQISKYIESRDNFIRKFINNGGSQ